MTVSIATRSLPFPDNLSGCQRRYIEAVHEHGTFAAAAEALGLSPSTVHSHLHTARMRVGVDSTAELVRMYLAATQHDVTLPRSKP